MNERLLKIMEHFNYSPSIFADEIGVIRSSISHIISGRNNPGLELLQKVLIRFPQISSDWLILGRGEMMLNEEELEKKRMTNVNSPKKIGQLNLDDFTRPREEHIQEPRPAAKPSELNIQENIFSKTVLQTPEAVPQYQPQTNMRDQVPAVEKEIVKEEGSVSAISGIASKAKSNSNVKRITIFFEDNSFRDFVESN